MKGFDVSFSQLTPEWCRRRKAEGYEVGVQCLWTGGYAENPGIKAVAASNLRNIADAGILPVGYANASPPSWWDIGKQMAGIKENAGAMWPQLETVMIDVEISGTTWARVAELADALRAEGKNALEVLYTARWFWAGHMGNDKDPRWLRFKLWNAYYDNDPDTDFGASPYGPWTLAHLVGEQYQGTTNLDGVNVDLNEFRPEYFRPNTQEDSVIIIIARQSHPGTKFIHYPGFGKVYLQWSELKAMAGGGNVAAGSDTQPVPFVSRILTNEDFDLIPQLPEDPLKWMTDTTAQLNAMMAKLNAIGTGAGATADQVADELAQRLKE